jgi:hypothetical protein
MPTSSDSPTAGELSTDAQGGGGPVPSEPFVADAADSNAVVEETNFPAPAEEDPKAEQEQEQESAEFDPKPDGSIWATYNAVGPVERRLSVSDLNSIGDKEATEDLVWNAGNRYQLEITDAHPLVRRYIEEQDGGFTVEKF